jgi:hypothetical protein
VIFTFMAAFYPCRPQMAFKIFSLRLRLRAGVVFALDVRVCAPVAQTGSLLYRGLAIRKSFVHLRRRTTLRLADCQSATQQTNCLRYRKAPIGNRGVT